MIVFDLDGTLADTSHRQHLNPRNGGPGWDQFHAAAPDDVPVPGVRRLWLSLTQWGSPLVFTGRNEQYRDDAVAWFDRYGLSPLGLFMRADDDYRPNPEIKAEFVRNNGPSNFRLWVDDHPGVAEVMAGLGVPCLLVRENGQ